MTRALVLLAITLAACGAHVDAPADDHAARDRATGVELAAHLQTLPGVVHASVLVATPFADPLAAPPAPGALAPPPVSASIALAVAAGADAPRLERDARLLAAAALHADPAALAIAIEPPASAPPEAALASVGPFHVAPADRAALAATLVAALAIIAALAAWIAALQLRRRRSTRATRGGGG